MRSQLFKQLNRTKLFSKLSATSLSCRLPPLTNVSAITILWSILAINGYTGGSLDFETTNNFFQQITEHSKQKLNELNSQKNEVLEALSPETFEVSAKRNSTIFKSAAYGDEKKTTGREAQGNFDTEIMEKLRESKHNI